MTGKNTGNKELGIYKRLRAIISPMYLGSGPDN